MNPSRLKPAPGEIGAEQVSVLLPLPLPGPYDYRLPEGVAARRGLLVEAPLGARTQLGVVWGVGDAKIAAHKLKTAVPLGSRACLPVALCDFVDWVAHYTLSPQGSVLALALRARGAFEADAPRLAYRRAPVTPARLTDKRQRVLEVMADGLARSVAAIAEEANVTPAIVRALVAAGALVPEALPEFAPLPLPQPDYAAPHLRGEQSRAADDLRQAVGAGTFSVSLLDGVTGSGKTETYFEAVAEALRLGRQVLILLPEIALSVQFLERFAARFGTPPAEWHSDLGQKQRKHVYRAVLTGDARVVVGARSALFLPFQDLGLIIVDEEHEQAYKQEEGVIYHARDMAVVRGRISSAAVVLVSATPSLESYVNAKSGRYRWLRLVARHGLARLPQIDLIDLRQHRPERGHWMSPVLLEALRTTLAEKEQALLFLNRRGYAPLTLCAQCGHKLTCHQCSAWLVEHRYHHRLVCHHCGQDMPMPSACPHCGAAESLIACGPGVERLAEEFVQHFPDAHMAIASSDTMHGPAELQSAISAMSRGEIEVLIGTQMIAKGHHFPNLTLVGVIDADLGSADGDIRVRERTFQLLHQVSGRAGRASKPGRVLVQTHSPDDGVLRAVAAADRDVFYDQERQLRQRTHAPPFGRLAALILSGPDGDAVRAIGKRLAQDAPAARGVRIWGPTPAFYQILRGRTRERLLVQAERSVDVQAYLRQWLAPFKLPASVRLVIDIDPVSFF